MIEFTEEIKKLIKYTLNRTAIFTLASVMALTTTGCNEEERKKKVLDMIDSSYVALVDNELKLIQEIELSSIKQATVPTSELTHNHYCDLITHEYLAVDDQCKSFKTNFKPAKSIIKLGNLSYYLSLEEEDSLISSNVNEDELNDILSRLKNVMSDKHFEETKPSEIDEIEVVDYKTLTDTITEEEIYVLEAVDKEKETGEISKYYLLVENYDSDKVRYPYISLFDYNYDNFFTTNSDFRNLYDNIDEWKEVLSIISDIDYEVSYSKDDNDRKFYIKSLNEFLSNSDMKEVKKDAYSICDLENLLNRLNQKNTVRIPADRILVLNTKLSDVEITENKYNNGQLYDFYILINDKKSTKEYSSLHDGLNVSYYEKFSGLDTLVISDNDERFRFETVLSKDNFVTIYEFLILNGYEDYIDVDYSIGQLHDINEYFNAKQKVLTKQ